MYVSPLASMVVWRNTSRRRQGRCIYNMMPISRSRFRRARNARASSETPHMDSQWNRRQQILQRYRTLRNVTISPSHLKHHAASVAAIPIEQKICTGDGISLGIRLSELCSDGSQVPLHRAEQVRFLRLEICIGVSADQHGGG